MKSPRVRILAAGLVLTSLAGAAPPDARALAARIDRHLARRWAEAKVKPAGPSTDAEFYRRFRLDLIGCIPTAADAHRFLGDRSPTKRRDVVERQLEEAPGYARHFSTRWRLLLAPGSDNDPDRQSAAGALEKWLKRQFTDNVPFDRVVHSLLTWKPEGRSWLVDPEPPSPRAFYMGRDNKPDELASSVSRLFLGVRLECAQCHDHPFARWKREQFWSQATFFTGLRRAEDATRELPIPGTTRKAKARFLDGKEVPERGDARVLFAEWLTSKDNPFFARAVVNRVWDHFFGIGLVDPVDDLSDCHPPSHPALLDELAGAFVDSGFDLKYLVRAILLTDAYQMTSVHDRTGPPPEPRLFARMNVKAMWLEQLFDSLAQATGERSWVLPGQRDQLLARFPHPDQRLDGQSSIPQALGLMNSDLMDKALRTAQQNTVSAVADAPFLDNPGRVEALFLVALGRRPSTIERARFLRHVESGDLNRTLGDVFWALLNSAEFRHNH